MGGCVASRIDNDDRVQLFKERRRLMKELVMYRGQFSDALMAYLRALRNTGATLRQFTESESLEIEDIIIIRQSSPSPTLPPPPPPPNFSPDNSTFSNTPHHQIEDEEESINVDEDDIGSNSGTPPPPIGSSSWNPFETFSDHHHRHEAKTEQVVDQVEEENWVETTGTDLQEEDDAENRLVEDDSSSKSILSWNPPPPPPPPGERTVSWRNNKSLQRIVKDLDDYFLRASALGREVAILMDVNSGDAFTPQNNPNSDHKRKSAKVFSALSWSWSSKSLLNLTKESSFDTSSGPSEPCKPGAHCITLAKLFAAEQLLHKEVKEEETVKLEHERKLLMLQRQKEGVEDNKFEKIRSNVENLELQIVLLQESVGRTCSSILSLVDEELYPQLVALTSGLMHMWKTMHECHQVQNQVSLQLKHIISADQFRDHLSSDYHRKAAVQLESEVQSWYNSFCLLTTSQREYVKTLCRWVQLTDNSLALTAEDDEHKKMTSAFRKLCEQWLLHLDRVPDKVAAEALNSLLSAVQSIILQQAQELELAKRCEKLEKRLEKESLSLEDMEKKFMCSSSIDNDHKTTSSPHQVSPRHPLSVKRERIRGLKKVADDEKSKYSNSIHVTKATVLNNLTTVLPNVFQALIGFTSACIHSLEAIQQINKIQQQQQQQQQQEEDETPHASNELEIS